MSTTDSSSDFDHKPLPSYFGDDENTERWYDRPDRTEDSVPRDMRGRPRILPLGQDMPRTAKARERVLRTYARPSDYAEVVEDHYRLDRWKERRIVDGMLNSRRLQLEWASLGDVEENAATKDRGNAVLKKALKEARTDVKADEGTGVHALTERHDHGLDIKFVPGDFAGNMADWKRLIKHFDIWGIECFVVEDHYRLAGTFDRLLWYHVPCPQCGANLRTADLKTGTTKWGGLKMAAQVGIYANAQRYDPATGERTPLGLDTTTGDIHPVCRCRGIIFDIPAGMPEGTGRLRWINIAQGWTLAVRLAWEIRQARSLDNWWLEFEPVMDIRPMIEAARTRAEVTALYHMHRANWNDGHTALASAVIESKGLQ